MGDAWRYVSGAERRDRLCVGNGIARGRTTERRKAPHPARVGGDKRRSRRRVQVAWDWAYDTMGKNASPRTERCRPRRHVMKAVFRGGNFTDDDEEFETVSYTHLTLPTKRIV